MSKQPLTQSRRTFTEPEILALLENPDMEAFMNSHVTSFFITALPADVIEYTPGDAHYFSLEIARKSPGRWAVLHRGYCYDANLNEEYESIPSSRTEKFKRKFRHNLKDAVHIAFQLAPNLKLMRWTVDDFTASVRDQMKQEPGT